MQNQILEKKEQLLLQKFITAEETRQERESIHIQLKGLNKSPKESFHQTFERIENLEQELKEYWKRKENARLIKLKTKEIDRLQQKQLISKKVQRDIEKQLSKIKRNYRPKRPKLDPLPYLSKIKRDFAQKIQQENNAEHSVEVSIAARTPVPFYMPGRFKLSNHISLSPNPSPRIRREPSPRSGKMSVEPTRLLNSRYKNL